jgi:probable HAF family extracellular repeat protein
MNPNYARPTYSGLYLALLAAIFAPLPAFAFAPLGDLPGGASDSFALGVSGGGSVVVGHATSASGEEAFRWTAAGGMTGLGDLAGGLFFSEARGVNADGSVVVGVSLSGSGTEAFRWTSAGGMVGLGDLPGGGFVSSAFGVNGDGSVIVGFSDSTAGREAYRWTAAGGMAGLGDLPGGAFFSVGYGVSGDGLVVVGEATNSSNAGEAFRWTAAGGMVGLGDLPGGAFQSVAYATSNDGSVVVGRGNAGLEEAFRWTAAGGMVSLGALSGGGTSSVAFAVNADGSVVVGRGVSAGPGASGAFRWTAATGMQRVTDWLAANGVAIEPGYTLYNATGVSADGSVVVGESNVGATREAYVARLSSSGGGGSGSGIITISNLRTSLSEAARVTPASLRLSGLVLHGAHSRPLARRVDPGKNTFWLAGDWGTDRHQDRDGNLGMAEAGLGRNFGSAQVNVSLGQTWSHLDSSHGGNLKTDGTYLMAEVFAPLQGALWFSAGGYLLRGDADIRRGYLNAGLPDASSASPDIDVWALRARLDWDSALALGVASLSPYLDLSYSESKTDAYTETGGGFPARFDARTERATELRLGANALYPLQNKINLIGAAEITHRFQDTEGAAGGQVIGLFGFSLPGADIKQTWLRVGVGAEGALGDGTASLMLNATSEGDAPTAWLAASYRMVF